MKGIKVSVIIPTFNRVSLLPRAVQSVLNQSYTNLELIIVDDYSNDATSEFIATLHDRRIRYFRHDRRRGAAAARNTGLAMANGSVVSFLDSDDFWLPNKLAKQIELLKNSPDQVALIYCGIEFVNEHGRTIARYMPKARGGGVELGFTNHLVGTSTILVRKRVIDEIGGFDERLPAAQDRDLWIRLLLSGYHVDFVPEILVVAAAYGERISSDPQRKIFAYKHLIRKYGHVITSAPKIEAEIHRVLGTLLLQTPNAYRQAINEFWHSFIRNPSLSNLVSLLAACGGEKTFELGRRVKKKLTLTLKSRR